MTTATQTTKYASKIQFRNAAKKAGVSINTESEYARFRATITHSYDINNKTVMWNKKEDMVGFELIGIDLRDSHRLHAAGFELVIATVPHYQGTTRTAYIYRLPLTK